MARGGEGEEEGEIGRRGGGKRRGDCIIRTCSGSSCSSSISTSSTAPSTSGSSSSNSSSVKSTGIPSRRRADIAVGAFVVGVDATEWQGQDDDGEVGREGAEQGEAGRRCGGGGAAAAAAAAAATTI